MAETTLRVGDLLDVQCLDRIGYVPTLQTSGQVWWFFTKHLSFPIASPAIMEKIGANGNAKSSRWPSSAAPTAVAGRP